MNIRLWCEVTFEFRPEPVLANHRFSRKDSNQKRKCRREPNQKGRLRYLVVVGLLAEVAEDNLFEQLAVGVVLRKKTHLSLRALFTMAVPSLSW